MKKYFLIPVLLICFTAQSIYANDWAAPTSTSDFAGFWESRLVVRIAGDSSLGMPESTISVDFTLECLETSGKDSKLKISVKFDLNKFMEDFASMPEIKASGLSKEMLWGMMSQYLSDTMENTDVTIGKYFLSLIETQSIDNFFLEDTNQVFFNGDRTKMLMIFDQDITQGLGSEAITKVIFTKR